MDLKRLSMDWSIEKTGKRMAPVCRSERNTPVQEVIVGFQLSPSHFDRLGGHTFTQFPESKKKGGAKRHGNSALA